MRKETTTGCWLTRRGFLSVLITGTFVALGFHAALPAQAAAPISPHSGLISGETLDASIGLQAFRGIPYAAPPVGALRWRPPPSISYPGQVCVNVSNSGPSLHNRSG